MARGRMKVARAYRRKPKPPLLREVHLAIKAVEAARHRPKASLIEPRRKRVAARRRAPLGTGKRFAALKARLERRGAKDPAALAAYIGRKKYGVKRFAQLSAKGRGRR